MKALKRNLSVLAFVLVMMLLIGLLADTLLMKRDDGIVPMKAYYKQPENTVDVLILGSSHAGMNLSTQLLWDECGLSSYALWSSEQAFWTSYYWLIEALKTQTPKLVILETFMANRSNLEYNDEARQVTSTEGMRLSLNKWRAIQAAAPQERWLDLLTLLPVVHMRYGELETKDFQYYPWNDLSADKGARTIRYEAGQLKDAGDAASIQEVRLFGEKAEQYLDRIIALCREKNIPLLLLNTPSFYRESEQPYYNRVAQIAEENGLPFLNFNLLDGETGFDVAADMIEDAHLNTKGSDKITRYLAKYLKENYDLPDHRGDARYESWELSARLTRNAYLPLITDTADYFAELARSHYVCYLVKAYGRYEMTEGYAALIEQIARIDNGMGDVTAALKDEWGFDLALQCAGPDGENWICGDEEKTEIGFAVDTEEGTVFFKGEPLCTDKDNVIKMAVYDPYTKTCVDTVKFSPEKEYRVEHVGTASS